MLMNDANLEYNLSSLGLAGLTAPPGANSGKAMGQDIFPGQHGGMPGLPGGIAAGVAGGDFQARKELVNLTNLYKT